MAGVVKPDPEIQIAEAPVADEVRQAMAVLGALAAATIHEAAGKSGAMAGAIQPVDTNGDMTVAGPAFTVRCEPYQTAPVLRAIDLATAGDVLVIDTGPAPATVWGGSSTIAAQHRGLAGLVTNGAIRDCAEVIASGFPVFAIGRSLQGTSKDKPGEIGGVVTVGGQSVAPGDFVRGDADGVVVIPADRIVATASAALRQRDREAALDVRLRAGERVTDVLGL